MEDRMYNEEEKEFHVAQGIWENNNMIFNMVKDHVDHLISKRLTELCQAYPATFIPKKGSIVDYKK